MTDQQPPPARPAGPSPDFAPQPPAGRSSTLMLVVVGLAVVFLSCSIIALAGLVGYNDGVHQLDHYADSTRAADINTQYNLALTDVAAGNRELAALRLEHIVVTLRANAPNAAALLTQVRAFTATPTPTLTPTASPTPENTVTPLPTATTGIALPDPDTLFAEAQAAFTVRDYQTAVDRLNILRGLAPAYRKADVDGILHDSLMALSRLYLTEPSGEYLAEGILLADQARAIAPIGDLGYEAYIAGRYLDGLNAEGMECLLSVREWESVYSEAPQYRDVAQRLARSYASCGDAYTYQTEYCPAEQYYTWSLELVNDGTVRGKRDAAREQCANATPTPTPTPEGGLELTPTVEGAPAQ